MFHQSLKPSFSRLRLRKHLSAKGKSLRLVKYSEISAHAIDDCSKKFEFFRSKNMIRHLVSGSPAAHLPK
jgi:hypothetical protein